MSETPDAPEDKVGYKRPPKKHQFQRGQPSPNPKGRPRKNKGFQALLLEQLNKKVTVSVNGRKRKVTLNEVILQQLMKRAAAGDLDAIKLIIKLNQEITPLQREPLVSPEEQREREAAAEKLQALLVGRLEEIAAAKKLGADRGKPTPPNS
jgi:hypothetical protein